MKGSGRSGRGKSVICGPVPIQACGYRIARSITCARYASLCGYVVALASSPLQLSLCLSLSMLANMWWPTQAHPCNSLSIFRCLLTSRLLYLYIHLFLSLVQHILPAHRSAPQAMVGTHAALSHNINLHPPCAWPSVLRICFVGRCRVVPNPKALPMGTWPHGLQVQTRTSLKPC